MIYPGPKSFLEGCALYLEKEEMKNNLVLGNCYNIILENRDYKDYYFLEAGGTDVSVKTGPKVIVAGDHADAVKELFGFYSKNEIFFTGVIGNVVAAQVFAQLSLKKISQSRTTLIEGLSSVNDLHLSEGACEPSRLSDLKTLKNWCLLFFEEQHLYPKKSEAEAERFIKSLMKQGNLFSWIYQGKVVSMAAIIRKTKNAAIIGFVYTPPQYRGKGFATSIVHQLSDYILRKGFRQSGLLVDESNSVARKIYAQIGYKTVSELLDLDFESH